VVAVSFSPSSWPTAAARAASPRRCAARRSVRERCAIRPVSVGDQWTAMAKRAAHTAPCVGSPAPWILLACDGRSGDEECTGEGRGPCRGAGRRHARGVRRLESSAAGFSHHHHYHQYDCRVDTPEDLRLGVPGPALPQRPDHGAGDHRGGGGARHAGRVHGEPGTVPAIWSRHLPGEHRRQRGLGGGPAGDGGGTGVHGLGAGAAVRYVRGPAADRPRGGPTAAHHRGFRASIPSTSTCDSTRRYRRPGRW
jgi:hypothetical protein